MGFVLISRQPGNRFRAAAGIPSFRSKANSTNKKGIARRAVRSSLVLGYTGSFVCADATIGRLFLATPPAPATQGRFTHVRTRRASQRWRKHVRTRQLSLPLFYKMFLPFFLQHSLETVFRYFSMCAENAHVFHSKIDNNIEFLILFIL